MCHEMMKIGGTVSYSYWCGGVIHSLTHMHLRFTKSFQIGVDADDDIVAFFSKFGFAVFRDVLSAADCEATLGAAATATSNTANSSD